MFRLLKRYWLVPLLLVLVAWYYFSLPGNLFNVPYSYVLEDRHGNLLAATVAADGQWRFPPGGKISEKFIQALVLFEDKRFYRHIGFDVLALGRAIRQNIRAKRVISGGSTITMQVVRLSRAQPRTYLEKILEIILATRLELACSKDEILALYAHHAPFGGNVVGVEAASWRYFGRSPEQLSWAEAATLAVLPNAPALIHPDKNREILMRKRNNLLMRLHREGHLDALTLALALEEPLPESPVELPQMATHLLARSVAENPARHRIKSTLQYNLQHRISSIAHTHAQKLQANKIFNVAVLVAEVPTGHVLAYIGNTVTDRQGHHGEDVDIIRAPRSTGSILKPFLFAAMLNEGKMLPQTLLPDVPLLINGFAPKNFSLSYDGAVPAGEALLRSLNIPAVHMLRDYRYEKFHNLLRQLGISTLTHPPDHYGLALIIGGAEGTLWDVTGAYASLGRVLTRAVNKPESQRYSRSDYHPLIYTEQGNPNVGKRESTGLLSAASIYQTFDLLTELTRPSEERGWKVFEGSQKIAWKTGTSYGFRDAWAVGVTPRFAVGVWVGNAGGEGRPGLTGVEAAAPVMFDVFSTLPSTPWFAQPYTEMVQVAVCRESGMRISDACPQADTLWVYQRGLETEACKYHRFIHLTANRKYRVHAGCFDMQNAVTEACFVLPPVQELYYARRKMNYRVLPPFRPDCEPVKTFPVMDWVYPTDRARLFIPKELNGQSGRAIFELSHRQKDAIVYWHLDGEFLGLTQKNHQMPVNPPPGTHLLRAIDQNGQEITCRFSIVYNM
ncbi:MAG: penicillin-binding protein 1C [Cyclobacteriaceae bacterium]|nr:MAG: penicillin-binding protein 1C [Cyclobacteriaceae bacterium]